MRGMLAALVLVFAAGPAEAYIDGAGRIMESVAAARAQLAMKTAVGEGYRLDDPKVRVVMTVSANAALRLEERGPDGAAVVLVRGRERHRFGGKEAPRSERIGADPLFELLANTKEDPGGQRGRALLDRLGVDASVVHLDRFDGEPAFIIGAAPGQLDRPQLWVDKRRRVPVRWLVPVNGEMEEVRLRGYGMPVGPHFPETIQTVRAGRTDSYRFTRIRLNEPVDARLLQPPSG